MISHKHILIYLTMITCLLIINSAAATRKNAEINKKTRFPVGCKPFGYKFDLYNVLFTPSNRKNSQTIYFVKNLSNKTVFLLQTSDGNNPYIMHIDGNIAPHKWSVLSVSENKIKFICTNYNRHKNDHQVINCQNVLRICEFAHSKFGTNHRGTYWLTLSKPRKAAVNITRFHGILLFDPSQMKKENTNEKQIGEN